MLILNRFLLKQSLYFIRNQKISESLIRSLSAFNNFNITQQFKEPRNKLVFHIEVDNFYPIIIYVNKRYKYTKKSTSKYEEDSDSDNDSEEFKDERDSKVIKANMNSLRADLILKSGLGMARNKVEVAFYENKIRINGQKPSKKSQNVHIGDEIDIIRGFSTVNPSLLNVSRVVILSTKDNEENISVQLRRYKNLLIENYEGTNVYRSSEE